MRVPFASCRHCEGVWLSREVIEGRSRAVLPDVDAHTGKAAALNTNRRCPQCGVSFDREKFADVVIDMCPKCGGVWLDRGDYPAARRRGLMRRLEREVPSLRARKSKLGMIIDRVIDAVGDFIERVSAELEEEPDTTATWISLGRKRKRR
jgi:Zn-finger nucleic acid-binding protein